MKRLKLEQGKEELNSADGRMIVAQPLEIPLSIGMKQSVKYCIYKEDGFYVAQCLNVDVSSFGESIEEAIFNIKEALELSSVV